jgi:glycosyltransferase involved in cell wall biosynthesis
MKKISVIIPVYNVENEVSRCIDSILSQSYKNIEIIIVDDGSTDNSSIILDKYGNKYSNINVIHQNNMGLSGARNTGLNNCTGDYISFIDSDDFIENNMYEDMILALEETDSEIAICGRFDDFSYINKSIQSFTKSERTVYSKNEVMKKILLWDEIDIAAWDKIYKRELWTDLRFPLGRNNEDICTIPKVISNSNKIVHVGKAFYHYCHRMGSITTTYNEKKIKDFYSAINEIEYSVKNDFVDLSKEFIYYKNHSYLSLWKMGEEIKYKGDEITIAKNYLKDNWKNNYSYSRFSRRDKIIYILLRMKLYRLLNVLFYRFRLTFGRLERN